MVFVTFLSSHFINGYKNIPMPEHCIPNVGEWIVFDGVDIDEIFVDGEPEYRYWYVISKKIVYNNRDIFPNIVCDVSLNTSEERLFLNN